MTDADSQLPYLQGLTGQVAKKRFTVDGQLTIGADNDQGIVLQDDKVAGQHAVIEFSQNQLLLSATQTAILNGEPVRSTTLKSGDELRIGQQRFIVKMPGLRPDSVLRDVQTSTNSKSVYFWLGITGVLVAAAVAVYFLR